MGRYVGSASYVGRKGGGAVVCGAVCGQCVNTSIGSAVVYTSLRVRTVEQHPRPRRPPAGSGHTCWLLRIGTPSRSATLPLRPTVRQGRGSRRPEGGALCEGAAVYPRVAVKPASRAPVPAPSTAVPFPLPFAILHVVAWYAVRGGRGSRATRWLPADVPDLSSWASGSAKTFFYYAS